MSRRRGMLLGALVLAVAPQLGCVSERFTGGLMATSAPPRAVKPVEKALPPKDSANLSLALAQSMEKTGHPRDAVGQYERARQQNPGLTNLDHRIAVLYDLSGDSASALAEYHKALAHSPKNADLLNDLGYCHYTLGEWAEAEKHLRQAVTINPKHQRAWINLGMTLAQQEQYDEGLEAFAHAVSPAEARCNLAFILMARGKREEAKGTYRQALELQPDLRLARAALARLEEGEKAPRPRAGQDLVPAGAETRRTPLEKLPPPATAAIEPDTTPTTPEP